MGDLRIEVDRTKLIQAIFDDLRGPFRRFLTVVLNNVGFQARYCDLDRADLDRADLEDVRLRTLVNGMAPGLTALMGPATELLGAPARDNLTVVLDAWVESMETRFCNVIAAHVDKIGTEVPTGVQWKAPSFVQDATNGQNDLEAKKRGREFL